MIVNYPLLILRKAQRLLKPVRNGYTGRCLVGFCILGSCRSKVARTHKFLWET